MTPLRLFEYTLAVTVPVVSVVGICVLLNFLYEHFERILRLKTTENSEWEFNELKGRYDDKEREIERLKNALTESENKHSRRIEI